MTAADTLLARLDGVRARGDGRWIARCPAHDDRNPSLSIRAVDDRVLLTCWSGCSALEIVQAVGLGLRDLFDRPLTDTRLAPVRTPPFATAMMQRIRHCATVLVLAADALRHRTPLTDADHATLLQAYDAIDSIVTQAETWPRAMRS